MKNNKNNYKCTQLIFPDVVRIETSGLCNFRCIHCATGNMPSGRGLLTVELFEELLSQFKGKAFLPRVAVLYHGGEPLLNPNLFYFIEQVISLGVKKIKMNTNSSLLKGEAADRLASLLRSEDVLVVSFDGTSPDENDSIRRNGCFARDSKHVIDFLNNPKRRCKVLVGNVHILEAKGLERYLATRSIATPEYLCDCFGDLVEYHSVPAMKWPGMQSTLASVKQDTRNIPLPTFCSSALETITILSNGDVVPCCYDIAANSVMGSVLKNTVFDIWDSQHYSDFRNNILNGKIVENSLCSSCVLVTKEYLVRNNE